MKLGIFCNFGPPDHIGGSEEVIKQVAHHLPDDYEVKIYSHSQKVVCMDRGVPTVPCFKGDKLIAQINENDHIFVYSDSFWGWDTIVENVDKVVPDVSVALVGAYHMREHNKATGDKFKQNIHRFRVVCHAKGPDYKWCVKNHIPYKIIPNGVDLDEFRYNDIDFRKKYDIKSKYILLNVSNYFYGKGQEALGLISKKLQDIDCMMVSVSNSISYPYERTFLSRAKAAFGEKDRRMFLRDLPREDVVAAFKCSDVFVFPSRKEIAPLVILESRAAGLPWVAFDVGNVSDSRGGVIVPKRNSFNKGYIIVDDVDIKNLATGICRIIGEPNMFDRDAWKHRFKKEMKRGLDLLDWKIIVPEYDRVFRV